MSFRPQLPENVSAEERRERLRLQADLQRKEALLDALQKQQDENAALISALTARLEVLEGEPETFAVVYGRTDGAGGFTTLMEYGCSTSISGNSIRLTFTTRGAINYAADAINASGISIFPTVTSESAAAFSVQWRTDAGAIHSAATNAFEFMIAAKGPRT